MDHNVSKCNLNSILCLEVVNLLRFKEYEKNCENIVRHGSKNLLYKKCRNFGTNGDKNKIQTVLETRNSLLSEPN